jgi:hypothetical protein
MAIKYLKDTLQEDNCSLEWLWLVLLYMVYVKGHEEQHFNVSVNYESNKAELLSFSREFRNMLSEREFDQG